MRYKFKVCSFTFCLVLLAVVAAFTQAQSTAAAPDATAAPVAYVYLQTTKGVDLYDAAANGKLTLVSESPFKTVGSMAGSNGRFFISLGTDHVRVYPVASNGAIKEQVSEINTQSYQGADCGTVSGGILDHTGKNLYVLLYNAVDQNGFGICTAYQSFDIGKTGSLTFKGAAVNDTQSTGLEGLPTITGNDTFAYAINDFDQPAQGMFFTGVSGFRRENNGTLDSWSFYMHNPSLPPVKEENLWVYFPIAASADPANHLAISIFPEWDPPKGSNGPEKLASYTVDGQGNITSTNTWEDMPTPDVQPVTLNMSPLGKLLAVAGSAHGGLQVFHFNGAEPITRFTKVLTTAPIDQIQWDNNNHLYALSDSTNKLYVFEVTTTSVSEAPGSPYTIASPYGLVVVPR